MPLSTLAGSSALQICGWPVLGVVTESPQATETLTFRFGFHPRGSSLHLEQHIDVGVPMSYVQSLLKSLFSRIHPLARPHAAAWKASLCAPPPPRLPVVGFLGHRKLVSLHFIGAICIHCPSVPIQHCSLATCTSIKLQYLSCKTGRKMFA